MNSFEEDLVITEVRRNRAGLLARFGGDAKKLVEYLAAQKPIMEAAGWRYETEAELEERKKWHQQQMEAENKRITAL